MCAKGELWLYYYLLMELLSKMRKMQTITPPDATNEKKSMLNGLAAIKLLSQSELRGAIP